MRVLVVGATGTIGSEIVKAFRGHDVVEASRSKAPLHVDISDPASIRAMYANVGRVDAVISAAGNARRKPLEQLTDEDFAFSLANKLMGQVNVVRYGLDSMGDNGSFTITSGVLSFKPIPGSGALSLVNSGLEGFARAAALDAPRGIRVNVVSPPWVTETLQALKMTGIQGKPAAEVAKAYVKAVMGKMTGETIEA